MAVTTNTDVYAINKLTGYLFPQLRGEGRPPVTSDDAAKALAHLCEAAYHKHSAGVRGEEVLAAWAKTPPDPDRTL
ncbi:hypothetical protein E1287_07380 [Actinomadura sp. KC06]|uniref:hypothetical protein n=1 Tax=Actinomadura sp. KC06 TaxID=2530369 RepID=UPI001043B8EF|nr:hypothetical protein [Actinomadura sp. KC06]TDD37869.1 hypothetical protein E1287_07380 [Actinomadura sp. KC06]